MYILFLDTKTDYFISNKRVGGVPTIDKKIIENLQIPIPPLEKQREIVEILDKFSELTTDLQSGLPAEISARRKQYEYYRDKLLKF
ncbi:restriction endonuclease subunit S [Campylobacter sp. faydin G-24]|uniref:Restriction endonuclease subunit S n=1 Tax=Campylobacter anatolicus TaxID=2829105 RepID=A0ABS5HLI8_9BACT|nr:restriction endonuclease subunit S [Campylobacter anatolicus]